MPHVNLEVLLQCEMQYQATEKNNLFATIGLFFKFIRPDIESRQNYGLT